VTTTRGLLRGEDKLLERQSPATLHSSMQGSATTGMAATRDRWVVVPSQGGMRMSSALSSQDGGGEGGAAARFASNFAPWGPPPSPGFSAGCGGTQNGGLSPPRPGPAGYLKTAPNRLRCAATTAGHLIRNAAADSRPLLRRNPFEIPLTLPP